jgi:hypothetical protein
MGGIVAQIDAQPDCGGGLQSLDKGDRLEYFASVVVAAFATTEDRTVACAPCRAVPVVDAFPLLVSAPFPPLRCNKFRSSHGGYLFWIERDRIVRFSAPAFQIGMARSGKTDDAKEERRRISFLKILLERNPFLRRRC